MKNETVKRKNVKINHRANPTEISIQQEIIDLKIQANKIQNKILKKERQLLTIGKEGGFFDDCVFEDKPE